ncbi:MAG: response regulator [Deltaproteobacteria bacterium]|nr:response regulator [Deltaproteobacteria bacterium]
MKIAIVEDELVSRRKTQRFIQSLGYETLVATDGLKGFELWQNERPRIVITDWIMPGLDGIDLCQKIREAEGSQYTYIIMVTSKEDIGDVVASIEAGADDFITKPFEKEELAVRIRAGERIIGFESKDLVIFSMAKLAESRDPETGNHLERIQFYSKVLAETLMSGQNPPPELNDPFIENIFLTSPLHDIGKIGIPDFILLKPGRLDDREFEIMKTHCQIGFDTLDEALKRYPQADYLRMSADIALSHHEKIDGTGYPNGLKGEEIPLSARIVAVADVYDALVHKRVYKTAYTPDVAKALITASSGSHFDSDIVEGFLTCEDKFIEILNTFRGS